MSGTEADLIAALTHGTLIAISDGSFKSCVGTAAFRLEDGLNPNCHLEGVLRSPGRAEDLESQRAELTGIYSIITATEELGSRGNLSSGSLEVGCDNTGALRIFDMHYVFDPVQSDFDLLSSLQLCIRTSPFSWTGRHVYGHQDDKNVVLDRWAHLNIRMDIMAKAYWNTIHKQPDEDPIAYNGTPLP